MGLDILCGGCTYFHPTRDNAGQCRFEPPKVTLVPRQGISGTELAAVSYWPEVRDVDACGMAVRRCDDAAINTAAVRSVLQG